MCGNCGDSTKLTLKVADGDWCFSAASAQLLVVAVSDASTASAVNCVTFEGSREKSFDDDTLQGIFAAR
jgi:hypothetical protein